MTPETYMIIYMTEYIMEKIDDDNSKKVRSA